MFSIYVAHESLHDRRVGLKEIAEKIASPEAFTAKILQKLVKKDILESTKGPAGGFDIALENIHQIRLIDIVTTIDGNTVYHECGLGLKRCSGTSPCPVHHQFKNVRENLIKMLENTTLYDLSQSVDKDHTFLKL